MIREALSSCLSVRSVSECSCIEAKAAAIQQQVDHSVCAVPNQRTEDCLMLRVAGIHMLVAQ